MFNFLVELQIWILQTFLSSEIIEDFKAIAFILFFEFLSLRNVNSLML